MKSVSASAKVDQKGRITIPAAVRKAMNLRAGDRILFMPDGQDALVIIAKNRPVSALRGMLAKPREAVSIEEMNKAIAEGASAGVCRSD